MREITLEELLTSGAHFGHQVNRRNPKADEYIFEARSGVNIIDLGKTREGLLEAAKYVQSLAARGGTLVVVGTKKQAADLVEEEINRARKESGNGIYFITSRWIGGILTNFSEVSKNFKRLEEIDRILASNSSEYTKREKLLMEREKEKLLTLYRGVADLKGIPDALFIIDTHLEKTAVNEGRKVGVRLVGITDTNADPSLIDYPIPANDDAAGSLKLIISFITDAWIEGRTNGEKASEGQSEKVKVAKSQDTKATKSQSSKESKEILRQVQDKKEEKEIEAKADNAEAVQKVDQEAKEPARKKKAPKGETENVLE